MLVNLVIDVKSSILPQIFDDVCFNLLRKTICFQPLVRHVDNSAEYQSRGMAEFWPAK